MSADTVHEFHFEGNFDYYMEGSKHFDEPALAQQRDKLRTSPKLRGAALQFWATLGKNLDDELQKEEYTLVHRLIVRALAPELTDEEAAEAAEEDWVEDLNGQPSMDFNRWARVRVNLLQRGVACHSVSLRCYQPPMGALKCYAQQDTEEGSDASHPL